MHKIILCNTNLIKFDCYFHVYCFLVKLTDEEKESLKKLGNKEFLLSKDDKKSVWLSLVDIVFAWAYNHRTTLGDYTVESAWTLNKLSATLSWFTVS